MNRKGIGGREGLSCFFIICTTNANMYWVTLNVIIYFKGFFTAHNTVYVLINDSPLNFYVSSIMQSSYCTLAKMKDVN